MVKVSQNITRVASGSMVGVSSEVRYVVRNPTALRSGGGGEKREYLQTIPKDSKDPPASGLIAARENPFYQRGPFYKWSRVSHPYSLMRRTGTIQIGARVLKEIQGSLPRCLCSREIERRPTPRTPVSSCMRDDQHWIRVRNDI